MNEKQARIWEYLSNNAVGYDDRKSSDEIRGACNLTSGGVTNEHVRDLIRDMILKSLLLYWKYYMAGRLLDNSNRRRVR